MPSPPIYQPLLQSDFSQPRPAPLSHARATMAPAASRSLVEDVVDPRSTLPGSRMTDPPDAPVQRDRSSRLWIVIAVLLIVMLFATIALLRYLQIVQAASLH